MAKVISLEKVLSTIFDSSTVTPSKKGSRSIITGTGQIDTQRYHVLGTIEETFLGVDEAITMADHALRIHKSNNTDPCVFLVDVVGQKLKMRDEWLAMYEYFAHLLQCLHLLREKGHILLTLVYNNAVGGGFIAFGLMADKIYALDHAEVAVMWLDAMANVTKIDESILREASKTSPVFAPGAKNFKKLGGMHDVFKLEQTAKKLSKAIKEKNINTDQRTILGLKRGGRTQAQHIIEKILSE